jgi:retron-type reverse transcriptase
VPSADETATPITFEDLVHAWLDCRRTKRNSPSALAFEARAEANLVELAERLFAGTWRPGRSICFVITRPKPREVWAAQFADRIVHHLLYHRISPRFERTFIADSCACIIGRGTLYAARRLERKVRSITQSWQRPAGYLKCDIANFFVAIDKRILWRLLEPRIAEPWWRELTRSVLFHDPRQDVELRGAADTFKRIPAHKSLFNQAPQFGLPIGNLSSQFFANVYLNVLDQFVKHELRVRHYVRYVDDFVLLSESAEELTRWHRAIEAFLPEALGLGLNPTKTIRQPVHRGIDFVGQVIRPGRRTMRRRTFNEALARIRSVPIGDVYASANSYFGLLRQATHSHADRAVLANVVRRRGLAVDRDFTKAYR